MSTILHFLMENSTTAVFEASTIRESFVLCTGCARRVASASRDIILLKACKASGNNSRGPLSPEGHDYQHAAGNEPSVKVHHAEKMLHLSLCGRGWKIADCIDMRFEWTNSIL